MLLDLYLVLGCQGLNELCSHMAHIHSHNIVYNCQPHHEYHNQGLQNHHKHHILQDNLKNNHLIVIKNKLPEQTKVTVYTTSLKIQKHKIFNHLSVNSPA